MNFRITPEGIKIKVAAIPAACHEIQELVEKIIKIRGLSYGVRFFFCTNMYLGYRIRIEILDANSQPFGLIEYFGYTLPNHPYVLFKWYSSTITNIPGESITLEDHIKRVLAHTFKPINRERRKLPMKK